MTDHLAEIIIFPGVRIEDCTSRQKRPRKRKSSRNYITIGIVLDGPDQKRLEQIAEQRGISPQDAAGRLLRSMLRSWRPWGGNGSGVA